MWLLIHVSRNTHMASALLCSDVVWCASILTHIVKDIINENINGSIFPVIWLMDPLIISGFPLQMMRNFVIKCVVTNCCANSGVAADSIRQCDVNLNKQEVWGSVTHWLLCYWINTLLTVTTLNHYSDVKSPASRLLLNRLFRRRSKKTLKLRVTGLCERNSPAIGEFPAQMAVTRKLFHLMTSS